MERMTVTQAARQFSNVINRVCNHGTTVELERDNRVIARISPVAQKSPVKAKDLNDFFRELPSLREDAAQFSEDIQKARELIPAEESNWD